MTEKELRKLSRGDLLELLLEQTKENEKLQEQIEQLNKQLSERDLHINNAGSLAEAVLAINGVFDSAQSAAEQYLENLKLMCGRQQEISKKTEEETKQRCELLEQETRKSCELLEQETKKRCELMISKAQEQVYTYREKLKDNWDKFYDFVDSFNQKMQ